MQDDLVKNKFVFFKGEKSFVESKKTKLLTDILIIYYVLFSLSLFILCFSGFFSDAPDSNLLKSSVVTEVAVKKEIVAVNKIFAAENVNVLKYLSTIDNSVSKKQVKQHFSNYEVSFKDFKPMTGFLKKENLLIYFDLNTKSSYISFNSMSLPEAYELKKEFDSVSSGYESKVILDRDSVSIIVFNDKYAHRLEILPLPVSKISDIKNSIETKKTMSMLPPIAPKIKEVSKLNKLQEKLESVKIDNLIIQEKIKQRVLMNKLSSL